MDKRTAYRTDVGDVAIHSEDVGLAGGLDRPRGGDDGVPGAAERSRDARPDTPRGAGDDRNLLRLWWPHATRYVS